MGIDESFPTSSTKAQELQRYAWGGPPTSYTVNYRLYNPSHPRGSPPREKVGTKKMNDVRFRRVGSRERGENVHVPPTTKKKIQRKSESVRRPLKPRPRSLRARTIKTFYHKQTQTQPIQASRVNANPETRLDRPRHTKTGGGGNKTASCRVHLTGGA